MNTDLRMVEHQERERQIQMVRDKLEINSKVLGSPGGTYDGQFLDIDADCMR